MFCRLRKLGWTAGTCKNWIFDDLAPLLAQPQKMGRYRTQAVPDYTKQLEEIVRALSRPSTPVWSVALISFALGLVSAVLLQIVRQGLDERLKRDKMGRVLYRDLADLFLRVESIMSFDPGVSAQERSKWRKTELKTHISFKGERYLQAHEDTYVQLPERVFADNIYTYLHQALDNLDEMWNVNWSIARQVFAEAVYKDRLKLKYFEKFMGRDTARELHSRCKAIYDESESVRKRWPRRPQT